MSPADRALDAINAVLTLPERAKIAGDFARANPVLGDLNADDVLDLLYQSDAHLDLSEPFYEANPDLAGDPAAAFAVLAVICLGWPLTRRSVNTLLYRAGLLRTLGKRDIAELAAQQRQQAEDKHGLAAIAHEIGAAALGEALYDLAREEERLAAKLEALAAAQYDPPATS
jgi:hypothetical protein